MTDNHILAALVWLRARLDDDERTARAATTGPWWHNPGKQWLDPDAFEVYDRSKGEEFVGYGESPLSGCIAATGPASHAQAMSDAEHVARWHPARVLAEVHAKQDLLAEFEQAGAFYDVHRSAPAGEVHGLWTAVKLAARPYAGLLDFPDVLRSDLDEAVNGDG